VFSMVLYPRQSGFLGRPGHLITDASLDIPPEVQFAYLRRVLPNARRVGVLYHPGDTGDVVGAATSAAAATGLELIAETVERPADAAAAMEQLLPRVDVVWSVSDPQVFTATTTSALVLATLRRRVPFIGLSPAHVRFGALAALSSDWADIGQQTAELARRVLRGDPVDRMPVTVPRTVRLAINLHTARHLGTAVPADVEREAAEVVR